ncbi:dienelactone hydrolase [Xylariaceae sp. FL0594]|nr:dienelactone hydrolase [Xylariaceae sp. FL0594]
MLVPTLLPALWSIGLFASAVLCRHNCPVADVSIIAHDGASVGVEVKYKNVTLYTTGNATSKDRAILYLTDIYGLQLAQNRLLADSFGRAGYFVVAPDLFNTTTTTTNTNSTNSPKLDLDEMTPEQLSDFLTAADAATEDTDAIIATALEYVTQVKGIARVGATGYCFGGKYAFRVLAGSGSSSAVKAGFAAHPSNLQDEEIVAVKGAVGVAAADGDTMMPLARRAQIEALLLNTTQPYSLALYGGVSHGFGVRANVSVPRQKFGKEEAFFQAVRWFDTWV